MFQAKRIEEKLKYFDKIQTISVSNILRGLNGLGFVEALQSLFDSFPREDDFFIVSYTLTEEVEHFITLRSLSGGSPD